MLVQDDPKDHFGWIWGPFFDGFGSILGWNFDQSRIDVEMILATKLDPNFGVP